MQVKKKPSLCTQFSAELIQLFITIAVAFRFCERVRIILANEKNNQSTKRIISLSLWQISKKFLNYFANAFTANKIHVITSTICLRKKSDASVWQVVLQENSV